MMKPKYILILFTIVFYGCNQKNEIDEDQLEIEIINQTISELAPEYPDIYPIEYPFTDSKELQKSRLDSAIVYKKNQIDSLGLEIWLYDELEKPNEDFFVYLKQQKGFEQKSSEGLKNKKINFHNIKSNSKTRIIPKNRMGNLPINNLGFAKYSIMIFNKNKDMAIFAFDLSDRTCTGGINKFVKVKKEEGNWKIIN